MGGPKNNLKGAGRGVLPSVFPDTYARSMAEKYGVHDPAWSQRKQPRNHQRAGKNTDHGPAVRIHVVTMRAPDAEREHYQREDRQQMDRAPRTDQPDLMDPERTGRHHGHQANPDPAQRSMRQRSLGSRQLHDAKHECRHG